MAKKNEENKSQVEEAVVETTTPVEDVEVKAEETAETIEEAPEEGTEKSDSTEEPAPVESEEVQKDEVTEAPAEEVIEEEATDEVVEEYDASGDPDSYGDKEDETPEVIEDHIEADPEAPEADPLPEEEGHYYLEVTVGYNKRALVEERLSSNGISFTVTATGAVLVGPYPTEVDAIKNRKMLLAKGLKGTVVEY